MATTELTNLFPDLFESAPWDALPASFAVDLLQFCSTDKPLIRSSVQNVTGSAQSIRQWAYSFELAVCFDSEGYFFVGQNADDAIRGRNMDRSCEPHEFKFGQLLGYPACCCRFVSNATESLIDSLAVDQSTWDFAGGFALINPTGYLAGQSLICHLPCSTRCDESLSLASAALSCLRVNRRRLKALALR